MAAETTPAPRVTVAIPCFNYGRYLAAAVRSVLAQTWEDWEAVIVNDGSTDDTASVVREFLDDPRVRYVEQSNRGASPAKNAALALARGELVAFLDADDVWLPGKLAVQLPLFDDPGVGVVYGRARPVDAGGRRTVDNERPRRLRPRAGRVLPHLLFDNFVPFSSSVVRRSLLESSDGFDESLPMGMDWDLWLRLAPRTRFDYVDDEVFLYRTGHRGQLSANRALRYRCTDEILERVGARHPELRWRIRRAEAYRFAVRAYLARDDDGDLVTSNRLYARALRAWPFEPAAVKGALKNVVLGRIDGR